MGLGDVIEDEGLLWEVFRQADGRLELLRINQDIVSQSMGMELRDPALEILPQHEVVVRLFLDDMTDTDELRVGGEAREVDFDAIGAQVDPADDTLHVGVLIR